MPEGRSKPGLVRIRALLKLFRPMFEAFPELVHVGLQLRQITVIDDDFMRHRAALLVRCLRRHPRTGVVWRHAAFGKTLHAERWLGLDDHYDIKTGREVAL